MGNHKAAVGLDTMKFWRENEKLFAWLVALVKTKFCAPRNYCRCGTSFGVVGHILGIRRTKLSDDNSESMLFAKVNFEPYDVKSKNW